MNAHNRTLSQETEGNRQKRAETQYCTGMAGFVSVLGRLLMRRFSAVWLVRCVSFSQCNGFSAHNCYMIRTTLDHFAGLNVSPIPR